MDMGKYKQKLLADLYKPYLACQQCPLGALGRKNIVFGSGNPDAKLMLIGEGPGQQEDLQGEPFVGRSGQLLNKALEIAGTTRKEIFITNVVKCRPPKNRKPLPQESEICKNILLLKQIKIIRPTSICTLGAAAIQALLNDNDIKITKIRGRKIVYDGINIIPTYHPAYILRNNKELETFISDILLAKKCSK